VTGASRGCGKGIALVLGEEGATVYVTGRSVRDEPTTLGRPGNIDDAAEEVTARGGAGIAVRCAHTIDAQVEALFDRIRGDHDRLDLLVNSAWSGYEISPDPSLGFLEIEWRHWDLMFAGGLRAAARASTLAAPMMVEARSGLIVNITWVLDRPHGHAFYEVVKNGTNKLTEQLADDLRAYGVACVAVSPGWMRLERMDLTPTLGRLASARTLVRHLAAATDMRGCGSRRLGPKNVLGRPRFPGVLLRARRPPSQCYDARVGGRSVRRSARRCGGRLRRPWERRPGRRGGP
jgi:NAD(P)-dependent dehydrogenase (short-subunit alcohol dehydrogenase family)